MARPSDPQRRDEIVQAARGVLLAEGYAGARMAQIALRAGVAPGTLYLYFPSKEAIVAALVEQYYDRLTAVVIPVIEQPDVAAAIAQTIETVFRFMAAERDLLKLARLEVGLRKPLALATDPIGADDALDVVETPSHAPRIQPRAQSRTLSRNPPTPQQPEPTLALAEVAAEIGAQARRLPSIAPDELARAGYPRLPAHLRLQRELVRILRARMAEGRIRQYDAEALAELLDGLFERIADLCLYTEGGDVSMYTATLGAFLRAALLP